MNLTMNIAIPLHVLIGLAGLIGTISITFGTLISLVEQKPWLKSVGIAMLACSCIAAIATLLILSLNELSGGSLI